MERSFKVFFKAKFVSFDSSKSGFFLVELFLDKKEHENKFLLANFNLCMSNSQSFYDQIDVQADHIHFYKIMVDRKKEINSLVYNKLNTELNDFFEDRFNDLFILDNSGEVVLNESLESELKAFINKKISSKVFNVGLDKFAFSFDIDVLSERDEFELKQQYFSNKEEEEDEDDDSEDPSRDRSQYLTNLQLVLSPSQGISIFLLKPQDVIYVRVIDNVPGDALGDYDQEEGYQEDQVTVEEVNLKDNYVEITVKFNDGRMGIIEEPEMVKVKGVKKSGSGEDDAQLESTRPSENKYSFASEFKKNLSLLVIISLIVVLIVLLLTNL